MSLTLLRRIAADHRRLVTAVGLLLLLDVLLYTVAVYPWSRRVARAEADAAAADGRLAQAEAAHRTAAETGADTARARSRLEQFHAQVLPTDFAGARAVLSSHLDRLAAEAGLVIERQSSAADRERSRRLSRLRTTMVLAGEYEDVRGFLHGLETASEFVLVDEVVLGRGSESDTGLVFTLGVSTYFRDPADEVPADGSEPGP